MIIWRDIQLEPAPHDRPIGMLSMQPQQPIGMHVTLDICQWSGDDQCFCLGYGVNLNIGHACATHWCEVEEMNLPQVSTDYGRHESLPEPG